MKQKVPENNKEKRWRLGDIPLSGPWEEISLCNWLPSSDDKISPFSFKKSDYLKLVKKLAKKIQELGKKENTNIVEFHIKQVSDRVWKSYRHHPKPFNVLFRYHTSSISALLSSMTSERQFSCQTILQKSSVVSSKGYWVAMYASGFQKPCTKQFVSNLRKLTRLRARFALLTEQKKRQQKQQQHPYMYNFQVRHLQNGWTLKTVRVTST